jgi:hypothetical protein
VVFAVNDVAFFREHPRRQARIRLPAVGEFAAEFRSLGDHDASRRVVLVWNCRSPALPNGLMKIPMLKYADEEIRDDDTTVMTILHGLMAARIGKPERAAWDTPVIEGRVLQ